MGSVDTGKGSAEKASDQQGGSQGGYQQYMNQYAGDYSKYMGGSGQQGSSQSATDLVAVADQARADEKAMGSVDTGKGSAEKASDQQGGSQGGYQQYMTQYAGDYSKYMGGSGQQG